MAVRVDAKGVQDMGDALNVLVERTAKARKMALKDAAKSTESKGRKVASEAYEIKAGNRRDRKKLHTRVRLYTRKEVESGEVTFSGGVGDPLRYFPSVPPRKKPNWKGINPRMRQPEGGVHFKVMRGGGFYLRQGPLGESTFWFKGNRGQIRKGGKWLVGYRAGQIRGVRGSWKGTKISTKGMFAASLIQALGRGDRYAEVRRHMEERFEKRYAHYLDVYARGILK